ncbi:MAG: hypothetical protein KDA73_07280 [Rhodobacteraceae bacterium]|nr:hypothetical protein [Paracoccaceae bacterium]
MLALTLIAAAAAGTAAQEPPLRLLCRFESACIDRRPCFDSSAEVVIRGIDGAADLAQLDFGDGRVRTARIRREGVWTSLVTEPDIDHGNRVEVLDFDAAGRATLVVNAPGTAVEVLSRTGTCAPAPEVDR